MIHRIMSTRPPYRLCNIPIIQKYNVKGAIQQIALKLLDEKLQPCLGRPGAITPMGHGEGPVNALKLMMNQSPKLDPVLEIHVEISRALNSIISKISKIF